MHPQVRVWHRRHDRVHGMVSPPVRRWGFVRVGYVRDAIDSQSMHRIDERMHRRTNASNMISGHDW